MMRPLTNSQMYSVMYETVNKKPMGADNPIKDIAEIWDGTFAEPRAKNIDSQKAIFLERIAIFTIKRDAKILKHGFKLGVDSVTKTNKKTKQNDRNRS